MSDTTKLSSHELELLKIALPFAQEIKETEDRIPTQEELREKLKCRSVNAKHIQHFLISSDALKVVARLDKSAVKADDKAVIQYATNQVSNPEDDITIHVLKENATLIRQLEKHKTKDLLEKKVRIQQVRDEIEELKAKAAEELPKPNKMERPVVLGGLLLELTIADLHIGKLAWGRETGHESYDSKIADAMYRRAQNTILDRAKGFPLEKILLVIGNDLLNSDNAEGTTTKGTQVATDGRYHKSFYRARNLMIDSIEQLRKVAPVHVTIMPGNHDRLATFHLGDSLEMYFKRYDDVTVDNEPTARRYFQYGKVLVMFTHGDQGKRADYPLIMATERPDLWAATEFREIHTGHYHQTRTEENHGVRTRIIPSLSPPDEWHSSNGYVGNLRTAEGYVWSKTEGLITKLYYNDSAYLPLVTKREIVN